jgi:hypothetical protein
VATLNLAYFFVEFAVARAIGSVSWFADSIDFLEDTAVNLLALACGARGRARVAMGLALLLQGQRPLAGQCVRRRSLRPITTFEPGPLR